MTLPNREESRREPPPFALLAVPAKSRGGAHELRRRIVRVRKDLSRAHRRGRRGLQLVFASLIDACIAAAVWSGFLGVGMLLSLTERTTMAEHGIPIWILGFLALDVALRYHWLRTRRATLGMRLFRLRVKRARRWRLLMRAVVTSPIFFPLLLSEMPDSLSGTRLASSHGLAERSPTNPHRALAAPIERGEAARRPQ